MNLIRKAHAKIKQESDAGQVSGEAVATDLCRLSIAFESLPSYGTSGLGGAWQICSRPKVEGVV